MSQSVGSPRREEEGKNVPHGMKITNDSISIGIKDLVFNSLYWSIDGISKQQ